MPPRPDVLGARVRPPRSTTLYLVRSGPFVDVAAQSTIERATRIVAGIHRQTGVRMLWRRLKRAPLPRVLLWLAVAVALLGAKPSDAVTGWLIVILAAAAILLGAAVTLGIVAWAEEPGRVIPGWLRPIDEDELCAPLDLDGPSLATCVDCDRRVRITRDGRCSVCSSTSVLKARLVGHGGDRPRLTVGRRARRLA